ncbi:contractile injection system tape measure protein [Runella sp. MFBS21]|uniref:contractile injection system tape measure protein n=1 Tax=Runella sp. MFBS21 TaxID=3034018 RepID=UPI0023F8A253|nr:contractile injection system tape measure protein [Runella sp. MFBS21]MDF7816977.1 contractile injection system tape measure protein [Runella sp. MFBS21]
MAQRQNHIVRKLQIEVEVRDKTVNPTELQHSLSHALQSRRVEEAIEGALSEVSTPHQWITLDKVTIDLGRITLDKVEKLVFFEQLQALLYEQVLKQIEEVTIHPKREMKTAEDFDFDQFVFFLENGFFRVIPITDAPITGTTETQKWMEAILLSLNETRRWILKQALLRSQEARRRIVSQFSHSNFLLLLEQLGKLQKKTESQLVFEPYPLPIARLKTEVMTRLAQLEQILIETPKKEGENVSPSNITPKTTTLKESIFIQNAGVVLLHPFINQCFKALGWIEGGRFVDEEKQQKGVLMWYFLATRQDTPAEHELVLPKILCGLLPQYVLQPLQPLTPEERQEGEDMLAAVIAHWSILKNTSPNGLRAEFLLREGKLEASSDMLILTVEQRASDILLSKLPWGISMIKLNWMSTLLYVNWF